MQWVHDALVLLVLGSDDSTALGLIGVPVSAVTATLDPSEVTGIQRSAFACRRPHWRPIMSFSVLTIWMLGHTRIGNCS